ncbi:MAG: hypothetical protein ACLSUW_10885 [Akkermansia sp.]
MFFRKTAVLACCAFFLPAAGMSGGMAEPTAAVSARLVSCEHAADGRVTARGAVMGTVFTVRAYPGYGMDEGRTENCTGRWPVPCSGGGDVRHGCGKPARRPECR